MENIKEKIKYSGEAKKLASKQRKDNISWHLNKRLKQLSEY
jgi:hypothetical protein